MEENADVAVEPVKEPMTKTAEVSAQAAVVESTVEEPAVSETLELAQDTAPVAEIEDKPTTETQQSNESKP